MESNIHAYANKYTHMHTYTHTCKQTGGGVSIEPMIAEEGAIHFPGNGG